MLVDPISRRVRSRLGSDPSRLAPEFWYSQPVVPVGYDLELPNLYAPIAMGTEFPPQEQVIPSVDLSPVLPVATTSHLPPEPESV